MDLAQLQPKIYADFLKILESNRLSHAYLFEGGFGSMELALFLAQSQFCQNLAGVTPCGHCRSCRLIASRDFSDVHVIEPSGQTIKTDTIREALRDFSRSGFEGQKQVFVIAQAERMHPNAANSLLKVIEEPQSDLLIFLLTTDANLMLPTIKSRCQLVSFAKNETYLTNLLEQQGLLPSQAQLLAQLAKDEEEALVLAKNTKTSQQIQALERFTRLLVQEQGQVYLEVARLVQLLPEKAEQEQAFNLLTLLLSEHLPDKLALIYLDKVYLAQKMWQSHVSFQNALEYMVIS